MEGLGLKDLCAVKFGHPIMRDDDGATRILHLGGKRSDCLFQGLFHTDFHTLYP
jgi:hypothetical protein